MECCPSLARRGHLALVHRQACDQPRPLDLLSTGAPYHIGRRCMGCRPSFSRRAVWGCSIGSRLSSYGALDPRSPGRHSSPPPGQVPGGMRCMVSCRSFARLAAWPWRIGDRLISRAHLVAAAARTAASSTPRLRATRASALGAAPWPGPAFHAATPDTWWPQRGSTPR